MTEVTARDCGEKDTNAIAASIPFIFNDLFMQPEWRLNFYAQTLPQKPQIFARNQANGP